MTSSRENRIQMMKIYLTIFYDFFQLHFPVGVEYEKQSLLSVLFNHIAPLTFVPILLKIDNDQNAAFFYVDDVEIKHSLQSNDGLIKVTPNGDAIRIHSEFVPPRWMVDDNIKKTIAYTLSTRFIRDLNLMDLTSFHLDDSIVDFCYCPLSQREIIASVLDIIAECTPDLRELNLNNNQLCDLTTLETLSEKAKNLKVLHLRDNKVSI